MTTKSSLTNGGDLGRRSSKTSEALNRCPVFALVDRRLRILLVSFRENVVVFGLSSSLSSSASPLERSVGEGGMGLSLEKAGLRDLLCGGEMSSGGGRGLRLGSGLLGSEDDL